MKKLITSLAILFACSVSLQAQIKLGLKFSPQLTWVNEESKNITTSGSSLNASYGLMIDKYFTENYAIATELCITSMTGKIYPQNATLVRNSVAYNNPKYTYKLQYIAVPVMLKMRTNEIGYFRYYAEFGLNFGFLFRGKADIKDAGLELNNVNINDPDPSDSYVLSDNSSGRKINDEVKFLRAALLVGAGIQYNIFGNTQLVAGLRYENSFSDFARDDAWKASLHMAGLHLGVLF
jgi:hypothetical protein